MKDHEIDVDRALAILEGDAPLVPEPRAWSFVDKHGVGIGIPSKRFMRAYYAHRRICAKVHRELRELLPVTCRICGRSFMRNTINQKRCTACVKAGKQYVSRRRGT